MERIHIPFDPDLKPGAWCISHDKDLKPVNVIHRCPLCKVASALLDHSITADGEVNASMACFPPCTFHIMGILDDWTYGVKEAGKTL